MEVRAAARLHEQKAPLFASTAGGAIAAEGRLHEPTRRAGSTLLAGPTLLVGSTLLAGVSPPPSAWVRDPSTATVHLRRDWVAAPSLPAAEPMPSSSSQRRRSCRSR